MRNKCRSRIRTLGILLVISACISAFLSCRVYAEPIEESSEKRLQEQISEAFEEGNVYTVIQDGSGDFTTIKEGVAAAESGDTLLIYPGVYEESVEISNKTVHLLGTDKDRCILQYESTRYNSIPLTFSAGRVANLTIYGYYEGEAQERQSTTTAFYDNSSLESIREWQKDFLGYTLHIDENYTYGKEAYVENCRIISNNNQCIGIGCRGNNRITFEGCELISNGSGGCIYFHNTDNEKLGGDAYFTMKDCELKNYFSPYVISMHSMGANNPVYLTFQNVRTSTVAYEDKRPYNATNMNAGFDVDEINALNQGKLLQQTGYYSSMKESFITYYDSKESSEYIASLKEGITPENTDAALAEGITYLRTKGTDKGLQERKRHIIDIFNNNQLVGDGWCGLDHIYLNPDSYGNTLVEMNYPMISVP